MTLWQGDKIEVLCYSGHSRLSFKLIFERAKSYGPGSWHGPWRRFAICSSRASQDIAYTCIRFVNGKGGKISSVSG